MNKTKEIEIIEKSYLEDLQKIKDTIRDNQNKAMVVVNSAMIMTYYEIGTIINQRKQWGNKYIERLSNVNGTTIDAIARELGIEYESLTQFMALQKGEDIDELAEKIQEIAIQLVRNPNAEIARFDVEVLMEEDDRGQLFANSLLVTYGSEVIRVSRFVCRGNRGIPCGNALYGHAGRFEEIIIGLAGTARVGKTAYLAALLASIMRRSDGDTKLGFDQDVLINVAYNSEEFQSFQEKILNPYVRGDKIEKTPEKGEAIPLFSLTFKVNRKKNYIFTFIDMPGEIYDKNEADEGAKFVLSSREIIKYARMIWLCVTPSQILGEEMVATSDRVNIDFKGAIKNIGNTMKAINVHGKIPTAVLITRSDEAKADANIFKPKFNPFSTQSAPIDIIEDKNENTWWVSREGYLYFDHMKWFIQRSYRYLNQTSELPVSIEDIFGKFTPFAVAAYGFSIDNPYANNSRLPTPSMIEGPFLWSLAVLGIIPAYEERTKIYEEKKFFRTIQIERIENERITEEEIDHLFYYPHHVD